MRAGAQHSVSLKTTSARQLQALVRRRHGLVGLLAVTTWAEDYESHPKNQEAGRDNEKSIDDRARRGLRDRSANAQHDDASD